MARGPEIFRPAGERPPLFFLHIPKTSGSAQNAVISDLWGDGALVHAESWFAPVRNGSAPGQIRDAVSGHIPYASWIAAGMADLYPAATVLRDPWERLVSHINWMDRFNAGIDPGTHERLSPSHARIVAALAETDLNSRQGLSALHARLTETGDQQLFDNLQVRMITPERPSGPVGPDDLARAERTLSGFTLVGFAEDQDAVRAGLERIAGRRASPTGPDRVNPARSARLSPGNIVAREILAPWHALDAELVVAARHLPNRARPEPALRRLARRLRLR